MPLHRLIAAYRPASVDSGSGPTTTWCYLVADETRLSANELASPDARQGTFANTIAPIVSLLQGNYAVARYDTRGISRSRLDNPTENIPVAIHADDVRRMLAEFGDEPAAVFGRSGRAVIGLALNQRFPEQVRTLVPHEPPLVHLLPEAEARRTAVQDIAWPLEVRERRVVGPNALTTAPPRYTVYELQPTTAYGHPGITGTEQGVGSVGTFSPTRWRF
jgi:pimeloyl-ACP methyl ester carboxylesterase